MAASNERTWRDGQRFEDLKLIEAYFEGGDRTEQYRALIRQGELLAATRLHREYTGAGLKVSKDYICALRDSMRLPVAEGDV